jgi:hypothetical protein
MACITAASAPRSAIAACRYQRAEVGPASCSDPILQRLVAFTLPPADQIQEALASKEAGRCWPKTYKGTRRSRAGSNAEDNAQRRTRAKRKPGVPDLPELNVTIRCDFAAIRHGFTLRHSMLTYKRQGARLRLRSGRALPMQVSSASLSWSTPLPSPRSFLSGRI